MMWVKCQNGDLVNLDNVVHIEKSPRRSRTVTIGGDVGKGFRVIAVGGRTEDDFYVLADKLSDENADALIRDMGNCIDSGVIVYSVIFALGPNGVKR